MPKSYILTAISAIILVSHCYPAEARQETKSEKRLKKCLDNVMAFRSPGVKKGLKIFGHKFNCHTAKRVELASWEKEKFSRDRFVFSGVSLSGKNVIDRWKYQGKLSHALRFRKDDQVYYQVTILQSRKPSATRSDRFSRNNKQYYICDFEFSIRTKRGGWGAVVGAAGRLIGKDRWEDSFKESDRPRGWENVAEHMLKRIAYRLANHSAYYGRQSKRCHWIRMPQFSIS